MRTVVNFCVLFLLYFWSIPKIYSQSSLGIEAGYGFPWAGSEISDGNITATGDVIRDIRGINWSYGAGKNYSISFSRFITSSIEAKCIVSYLDGSTVTKTVKFPTSDSYNKYKANVLWLSPTLIYNVGNKKIRPYAYTGFIFGAMPKIANSQNTMGINGSITQSKYIFYGGAIYGITSGIGFKFYFKKNTKWYFSSEARLISASYGPKKGELVQYNINGTDVLNSISIIEKKTIYKDNYTVDHSVPENPNEPALYSRRFYPFSSLGINIGMFYAL